MQCQSNVINSQALISQLIRQGRSECGSVHCCRPNPDRVTAPRKETTLNLKLYFLTSCNRSRYRIKHATQLNWVMTGEWVNNGCLESVKAVGLCCVVIGSIFADNQKNNDYCRGTYTSGMHNSKTARVRWFARTGVQTQDKSSTCVHNMRSPGVSQSKKQTALF